MRILRGDSRTSLNSPVEWNSEIKLKIRGQTSAGFPKKSYTIKPSGKSGEKIPAKLLGMPPSHTWIFHGPYSDKSLLRNVITFSLARSLGQWAPQGKFIETFIQHPFKNKNELLYQGIYLALEKIEVSPHKLILNSDQNGKDPGFLFRLDPLDTRDFNKRNHFVTKFSQENKFYPFSILFPLKENSTVGQTEYLRNWISEGEVALQNRSGNWRQYFDEDSFIDGIILQDFSLNPDAFNKSQYFHKQSGGRIRMGPIWDFNLAYGNVFYRPETKISIMNKKDGSGHWISLMLLDQNFRAKLKKRWQSLRGEQLNEENLSSLIDSLSAHLQEAQQRNFHKWDILGKYVWPNPEPETRKTYQDELQYLKSFIFDRLQVLDRIYGDLE